MEKVVYCMVATNKKDIKVVINNVTVFFVLKQLHNGAVDKLQNET